MTTQIPNSQNTPIGPSMPNPDPVTGRFVEMPAMDPASAKKLIESRPLPVLTKLPKAARAKNLGAGSASNIVPGQSSIVELARALKNDPQLMFEWVYNNVDFYPTYGLQKSAATVAIDGYGNSFDQSALLIGLLRQAGFTASYVLGTLQLTLAQCQAWLGTDTNIYNSYYVFANGGIPVAIVGTYPNEKLEISHCWVRVVVGGNTYVMDPSFKSYTDVAGMNLATATGYSQSTFLSQATSGATIDPSGNWLQNLNTPNINSQMQTIATNLVNYIKTNNPTATMDDVIGGRKINKVYAPFTYLTALSYQKPGDVPTIWATDIPTAYKITVSIDGSGIGLNPSGSPLTFTGDQLYGKRLTLFYNSLNQPVLTLDGTVLATGSAQWFGSWNSIYVTINHNAYSSTSNNQGYWQRVNALSTASSGWYYLLSVAFGRMGKGMIDFHSQLSQANDFAGGTDISDPILGERLAVRWAMFCAEHATLTDTIGKISKICTVNHHMGAMVGYFVGATNCDFIDIQGNRSGRSSIDSSVSTNAFYGAGIASSELFYALEDLSIRQYNNGLSAASTTKILHSANLAGTKIYKGTQANWAGTVSPALSGYNPSDLNDIATYYLPYGYSAFIPEVAGQAMATGTAYGWSLLSQYGGGLGVIWYNKGGWGDVPQPPKKQPPKTKAKSDETDDPVSLLTGDFLYRNEDISIGSGEFPYRFTFDSEYDSRLRYQTGSMGLGWRHNWDYSATRNSDGFIGLGNTSPLPAAPTISLIYVLLDLLVDNTLPIQKVLSTNEAIYWWIEQMYSNTVTVSFLAETVNFAKLADGTYYPLETFAGNLSVVSGNFRVTTAQKVQMNFNAAGQLATIVYPYGVTITLTYTSGKLTSISNGMGRTLTLSYTGNLVSSVADGTGRSISYGRDGANNLTSYVDANGKSTTFQYLSAGLMEKYFYPAFPTTAFATNTFDSLGRVKTQANARGQISNFYFAGSRTEIVDPAGNKEITYWDNQGDPIREVDALGFVTSYVMDGKRRAKEIVRPEGNKIQYVYDANNNPLTTTFIPKSGSGLANIVENRTFDVNYAKLKTFQDGRGNTKTYNYDAANGNLLNIQRPIIGGLTPTTVFTWNSRGQVLTITDETGIVTKFTYDAATEKLLTRVDDFGVGRLNLTTSFGFDGVGNVTSVTDARLLQVTYLFDSQRRVTQKTEPSPFGYVSKWTYDDNNNLIKQERQTGTSPAWQTFSWTFSATNKRLTEVDPANKTTTCTYDGSDRLQTILDAQSRLWQFGYDALNRLNQITDPNSVVGEFRTFTANGFLASIKDARNYTTQITWDGFDRKNKTTYPDTTFEQNSSYDANGNVLTYVTRSGSTIVNTWDVLNRLSTKTPTGQPVVTNVYDLAGRLTQSSKPVVTGDPSSGAMQFFYDTAGRFYKEQYPDGKIVLHALDANGNRTKTTWPDGYFVDRVYDQLDRLTNIKLNGSATSAVVIGYNQLSQRTSLTYSNGTSVAYTPQLNEDLTGITHTLVGSSVSFTYGYNNVHEPLTQTVSDSTYMWHPSPAGTVTYGTADNVNKYPTVGGMAYTYSSNKNLTGDGIWTFGYDTENHLLTAVKTGTSASFVYDPLNRQSQKTVGSVKSRYVYSDWDLIAQYDGTSGSLQNRYVFGDDVDEPMIQVSSAGVLSFLHADKQGSIVGVSTAAGAIANKNTFSPFGEITTLGGTIFGFTGQRYDSETGLYYYKHRYYSPKLGRFLQPDPLRYGGGDLNLYTYVKNSPLLFADAYGLEPSFGDKLMGIIHGAAEGFRDGGLGRDPEDLLRPRGKKGQTKPKNNKVKNPPNSKPSTGGNDNCPKKEPEKGKKRQNRSDKHGSFSDPDHLGAKYDKHGRQVGARNEAEFEQMAEDVRDNNRGRIRSDGTREYRGNVNGVEVRVITHSDGDIVNMIPVNNQ